MRTRPREARRGCDPHSPAGEGRPCGCVEAAGAGCSRPSPSAIRRQRRNEQRGLQRSPRRYFARSLRSEPCRDCSPAPTTSIWSLPRRRTLCTRASREHLASCTDGSVEREVLRRSHLNQRRAAVAHGRRLGSLRDVPPRRRPPGHRFAASAVDDTVADGACIRDGHRNQGFASAARVVRERPTDSRGNIEVARIPGREQRCVRVDPQDDAGLHRQRPRQEGVTSGARGQLNGPAGRASIDCRLNRAVSGLLSSISVPWVFVLLAASVAQAGGICAWPTVLPHAASKRTLTDIAPHLAICIEPTIRDVTLKRGC